MEIGEKAFKCTYKIQKQPLTIVAVAIASAFKASVECTGLLRRMDSRLAKYS